MGVKVFVCDNLTFSGDLIALRRKHTAKFDLNADISRAVDRYQAHLLALQQQITRVQDTAIGELEAKALIVDAFRQEMLYRIDVGILSPRAIWYTAVLVIVAGHALAVHLAHLTALRAFGDRGRALRSQYPMLVLMVTYTMLSLWILAQPLHLSEVDVQVGEQVLPGQQIGLSGNTGCSTGPHLHFGVVRLTNTNIGQPALIDPYGWQAAGPHPWAQHPQGAASLWLWKEGQAPPIYRQRSSPPNPAPGDAAPIAITGVRWMGVRDEVNPNNEYVELTLDPRFVPAGTFDLTGFSLRNNSGAFFTLPAGFTIVAGQPVQVFTGSGRNTTTTLFGGLNSGVWSNMGDCAHLVRPNGVSMYRFAFNSACN